LRYGYFRQLIRDGMLDKVATAHTLDDQAETILLRLSRGTGITGLAGIYPEWPVERSQSSENAAEKSLRPGGVRSAERTGAGARAAIIRPLLEIRRGEVLEY